MKRTYLYLIASFFMMSSLWGQSASASSQPVRCVLQGVVVSEPKLMRFYMLREGLEVEEAKTNFILRIKKVDGSVEKNCRGWSSNQTIMASLNGWLDIKKNQKITLSYFYKDWNGGQRELFTPISP